MRISKTLWLGASAILPMLLPAAAMAQTAAAPVAASESGAEEIIVTARKTEEKLQDAPIAVAVVSSANIDRLGFSSLSDLSRATAGLIFDDSFGRDANRPVIRGQANILGQSGVAFFIDGIYFNGSLADYDVDTIARMEVAKGPQSALYGRNTYSGAINIISKGPSDHWTGRVQADISEGTVYDITASVSGPITDGLGISLGGRFFDNPGLFTNAFDGTNVGEQSTWSGFGMLKFDQGGAIRASLRANYNKTDDGQPAIFATSANANNCFTDNGTLYRGQGRYFCGVLRPQQVNTDYSRQFVDRDDVGLRSDTFNSAFTLDIDFSDNLTLTSLSGYNSRIVKTQTDGDYSPNSFQTAIFAAFPVGAAPPPVTPPRVLRYSTVNSTQDFSFSNRQKVTDFSQELRLQYQADRLRLMIGGYYFKQNDDSQDTRIIPSDALARAQANANAAAAATCARIGNCGAILPITASLPQSRNITNFDIRNIAVFGSAQFDITDRLSLTAEGRYAEERIEQSAQIFNSAATVLPAPTLAKATFKRFAPRITASFQATPNNLLYAVYAEGQKPGGFNSATAILAGLPSYDAENAQSFEIGSKNTFLDGKLTANFALFHNEISGYQLTQAAFVPPLTTSAIFNAGDARVNGVEIELLARPSKELTLTMNYALADSKFTSGTDENLGVLNDVTDDGLVNCSIGDQLPDATCQSKFGDISGRRIPRAPVHSVFVDVDYRRAIGNGDWKVFVGMNAYLLSTSSDQVTNLAQTGDSLVSDIRAGFQSSNYRIQFYVRNLFDEDSISQIIRYADANNDLRRNFIGGLRPPRRFGVIAEAKF